MSELSALSAPVVGERADLLAVPLGATEQHGPHLPLGTDTTIAVALARALADRRSEVIAAPALPYGSSGEHQDFPGTLSIGQAAVEEVLVQLARSATETFARVLFVSAHGGNAAPLARALARLGDKGRDVRAWSPAPVWSAMSPGGAGDAHAGHTETSVMLTLAAETVDLTRAVAGTTAPLAELIGVLARDGVRAVSPSGVLGDPSSASAVAGRRLLEAAVAALSTFVADWTDRS